MKLEKKCSWCPQLATEFHVVNTENVCSYCSNAFDAGVEHARLEKGLEAVLASIKTEVGWDNLVETVKKSKNISSAKKDIKKIFSMIKTSPEIISKIYNEFDRRFDESND